MKSDKKLVVYKDQPYVKPAYMIEGDVDAHHSAEIEEGVIIGDGTKIWHLCHIREGAIIGRDCVLGRNVYVEEGALIGNRVHIQNNVSVYSGVKLFDDVFVGPGVVFTNDKYPRAFAGEDWERFGTYVYDGASIGAGAVIVCGVEIGEYAMVAAGAVVSKNVKPYELIINHNVHNGYVDKRGIPCPQSSASKEDK